MLDPCPPRFERHNLYRLRRLDPAREFLDVYGFGFDVPLREKHAVDLRLNTACLGNTAVIYMEHGARSELTHRLGDVFWIVLPVRDPVEATAGEHTLQLGPARAAVTSPSRRFQLRMTATGTCLAVGLREPVLRQKLGGLLGDDPDTPVAFAPAMELTAGPGSRFARHMSQMAHDFFQGGPIFHNTLTARSFEDLLINELLLRQPNNYSDRLRRLELRIAPRDMRRAAEFIDAHLDTPITIEQVAAAAGIAGRTLHKHFQDVRGTTPMRYVRERRYERARQELLHADGNASVTAVATRWGFSHLGRFAVEYRSRFGETPSDTLRRRPRRRH